MNAQQKRGADDEKTADLRKVPCQIGIHLGRLLTLTVMVRHDVA